MNVATLTWFIIAACVTYAVAVDENVLTWLALQSKSITIWFQRQWFFIRHNPDSPWVRWEIDRNANKLAKELIKQYKQEKENGPGSSD
jgi:hypothetical protein